MTTYEETSVQSVSCAHCGAQSVASPPHGDGEPCPLQARLIEAQIQLLEAQASEHRNNAQK